MLFNNSNCSGLWIDNAMVVKSLVLCQLGCVLRIVIAVYVTVLALTLFEAVEVEIQILSVCSLPVYSLSQSLSCLQLRYKTQEYGMIAHVD